MSVILHLPEAVERQLSEKAVRSGQTLEEYLQGLAAREAMVPPAVAAPGPSYPPDFPSAEPWVEALRAWAASHPRVERFVDDSRESIYADQGE